VSSRASCYQSGSMVSAEEGVEKRKIAATWHLERAKQTRDRQALCHHRLSRWCALTCCGIVSSSRDLSSTTSSFCDPHPHHLPMTPKVDDLIETLQKLVAQINDTASRAKDLAKDGQNLTATVRRSKEVSPFHWCRSHPLTPRLSDPLTVQR